MNNNEIYEKICRNREQNPVRHHLIMLSVKYEDFMSSAVSDRKKRGRLSENTLQKMMFVKEYRRRMLNDMKISFDTIKSWEKSHGYTMSV